MQRIDGPSLLELLIRGDIGPADAGGTLARVHAALHARQYHADLWSLREFVDYMAGQLLDRGVPADVVGRAREIANELPEDATLCHGDLHFGNVLMTDAGPACRSLEKRRCPSCARMPPRPGRRSSGCARRSRPT
jgi:hypothetical protein